MSNSGAQHFLASGKHGAKAGPGAVPDFSVTMDDNGLANFAMARMNGVTATKGSSSQEQAADLLTIARRSALAGNLKQAVYMLNEALKFDEKNRLIHSTLGEIYELMEQPEKAILCHVDALRLEPQNPECLATIGSYLMRLQQEEEAINYFKDTLRFDPDNESIFGRLVHLQRRKCDWSEVKNAARKVKRRKQSSKGVDPFSFLSITDDPAMQMRLSIQAAKATRVCKTPAVFSGKIPQAGKIRIGYLSCDFHDHATMFLMGRMLELHDRDKFEIYIYDYGAVTGQKGQDRAASSADVYRQLHGLTNKEIASLAREDGLDIAFDLKGHTKGNRLNLFDYRLAPLQIAYLGYPGTSGIKEMDYMVADPLVIPVKYRKHYTEKILYMPDCYQSNDDGRVTSPVKPSRADVGLPEDALVFCSFNSPYKVSPEEFDIWMKLLQQVPDSVLWFYTPKDDVRENILKEAGKRGVEQDRIVFAGFAEQEDHLARMPLADVFLDTFNVNAHTTASDALWTGVPVVTKVGQQFAARVAYSILDAIGMSELAVHTTQQYHTLCLKLARDPEYLADVKARVGKGIREGALYDSEKFTRNFEALLEKAVERYNAGLKPDHISLN